MERLGFPNPATGPETQTFARWISENPWFGSDEMKTQFAIQYAKHLKLEQPSLIERMFFDREIVLALSLQSHPNLQLLSSDKWEVTEMRKAIITGLLLTCGTSLAAPQWAPVGVARNENVEAFVDLGSIHIDGNIRSALFQFVYAPHSKKDERVNKWRKVSSSQETFNCANETSRVDTLNVRYEDGTEWSGASDQLPTSWTLIGPNTLRDFQRRFICKGVPK
jgi:hypothetical protein